MPFLVTSKQKNGWNTPMMLAPGLWLVLKINSLGGFGKCLSTNLQDSLEGDIVSICQRACGDIRPSPSLGLKMVPGWWYRYQTVPWCSELLILALLCILASCYLDTPPHTPSNPVTTQNQGQPKEPLCMACHHCYMTSVGPDPSALWDL